METITERTTSRACDVDETSACKTEKNTMADAGQCDAMEITLVRALIEAGEHEKALSMMASLPDELLFNLGITRIDCHWNNDEATIVFSNGLRITADMSIARPLLQRMRDQAKRSRHKQKYTGAMPTSWS